MPEFKRSQAKYVKKAAIAVNDGIINFLHNGKDYGEGSQKTQLEQRRISCRWRAPASWRAVLAERIGRASLEPGDVAPAP